MVKGGGPKTGQVRLDDGAPSGECIEAQSDGHAPVAVRAEYLGGVSVSGAEVCRPRPGQRVSGLATSLVHQVCVYTASVSEQALASAVGGLGADQQHQAWRAGEAGSLRMRVELPIAESGEPGSAGVARGVADSGQPVGIAVTVWRNTHDAGGEGQHGLAGGEPVESD